MIGPAVLTKAIVSNLFLGLQISTLRSALLLPETFVSCVIYVKLFI